MKIQFLKSAVLAKDYPIHRAGEIAILGRSNAGKSTFINLLAGSKIAKVSQTPGKTRLLNFFAFPSYVLVDMPGYGFASRGRDEIHSWQEMIETYLLGREQLRGVLLVMDIRRDWTTDEEMLKDLALERHLPILIVLTKSDKMSFSQVQQAKKKLMNSAGLEAVFATSSLSKVGVKEVENYFFNNWMKGI